MAISDYVTGLAADLGFSARCWRSEHPVWLPVETSLLQATLSFIARPRRATCAPITSRTAWPGENAHAFAFVLQGHLALVLHCSVPEKFGWRCLKPSSAWIRRGSAFQQRESRRQNYEVLENELVPTFKTRTRDDGLKRLEIHDAGSALVHIAEALADTQVEHLQRVEEVSIRWQGKNALRRPLVAYDHLARATELSAAVVGRTQRSCLARAGS